MENNLAYLIPIVAIVGGIIYAIFYQRFRTQRRIADSHRTPASTDARANDADTSAAVLLKVAALERRVGDLEQKL